MMVMWTMMQTTKFFNPRGVSEPIKHSMRGVDGNWFLCSRLGFVFGPCGVAQGRRSSHGFFGTLVKLPEHSLNKMRIVILGTHQDFYYTYTIDFGCFFRMSCTFAHWFLLVYSACWSLYHQDVVKFWQCFLPNISTSGTFVGSAIIRQDTWHTDEIWHCVSSF
jgi:hypothetical protein